MSTNFYIFLRGNKHRKDADEFFPNEYRLTDIPDFGYEIHIGKRSAGWKPLFEAHPNAYKSIRELCALAAEHPTWEYIDEYGESYTFNELEHELIDWEAVQLAQNDGEPRPMSMNPSTGLMEDAKPDDILTIDMPFSHEEYQEKFPSVWSVNYWEDEDGYDFTSEDFS